MRLTRAHLAALALFFVSLAPQLATASNVDILDLDLSSLMEIQVTSAGRKAQNINDVPAAIYVIDQDDIRNSGVTSIPEALRMVPGLQVARISSSKWAITSRGFSGTFANKLLVQIDGRSVYTPSYSGVYWDTQNLLLDDVDRIEVIRGPGATLWGSNAVNGIINIITRQASDTLGGLVSVGSGNHEKLMASGRYGVQFGSDTYGRFYVHRHEQNSYQFLSNKSDAQDDWKATSGGFRFDGDLGMDDAWTFQGDYYKNDTNQRIDTYWVWPDPRPHSVDDPFEPEGFNLLGRWTHKTSETSSWSLQSYYDDNRRHEVCVKQRHKIFDLDFQHRFQPAAHHDLIWGLGYRMTRDNLEDTTQMEVSPEKDSYRIVSAFLQDEISLTDRLQLTLGSKFEHNDFSEFEIQPSLRLLWKPLEQHSVWMAVARTVRTPSRFEDAAQVTVKIIDDPTIPGGVLPVYAIKNENMDPEELIAYEAGYRFAARNNLSFDMSVFYNDYDKLRTFRTVGTNLQFYNGMKGYTYGLELTNKWSPASWFTSDFSYSYIKLNLETASSVDPQFARLAEHSSPRHQFSLRTNFRLAHNLHLNLWGRYVDGVSQALPSTLAPDLSVDEYFDCDANIIWNIGENLELMVAGQNLLDSHKLEFIQENFISPIEIGRSFYAKLTWKF